MKLFLDDVRVPKVAYSYTRNTIFLEDGWDIVRDYDQFVAWITKNGLPDFIAFDHDLADEHYSIHNQVGDIKYDEMTEKTGMDCAKWLVDYCMDNELRLPEWYTHSMNPAGTQNIDSLLVNFKKHQEKNGFK